METKNETVDEKVEVTEETPKKTTRRRTTTKKDTAEASAEKPATAAESKEAAPEAKPAAKRGRKKKVEEAPSETEEKKATEKKPKPEAATETPAPAKAEAPATKPAPKPEPAPKETPVKETPAANNTEHTEAKQNSHSADDSSNENSHRDSSQREHYQQHNNNNNNNRDYRHNNKKNRNHKNNRNKNHEKSRPVKTRYLDLLKEPKENIIQMAADYQVNNTCSLTFEELTFELFKKIVESEGIGLSVSRGILEILQDGYGFLRRQMCTIDQDDVYVSNAQIKKFGLRTGDYVVGQTRFPKDNESYQALLRVECINDMEPDRARKMPQFDKLVPLHPNQKFCLHTESKDPSVRIVDLVTPIGKGQRGLIVAPPKAGKTTLLKQIANSLTSNHPDLTLFVLLIDERPEEVTDMTRSIEGEVIASTFDQHLSNHIRVSEMVLERAKRLVEQGKDVVILLDSITRLARAYNIAVPSSGQTLSGGVNPLALYKPKKFFGSARKIEFGGSLTILATALVDTGSKMDDVIFEEFKGTGNMELHLDRTLFNKRIFPSLNLSKSSTRREELLVTPEALKGMTILRRVFESLSTQEAIELLKKQVKQTRENEHLLLQLLKSADHDL